MRHDLRHRYRDLTPTGLTDILFGHAAFQYLNAGCHFGVFDFLYRTPNAGFGDLLRHTGISERSLRVLLFGLQSLRLIVSEDDQYSDSGLVSTLMDCGDWSMVHSTVLFETRIAIL